MKRFNSSRSERQAHRIPSTSRRWLDYVILVLLAEKIIQHTFVSLAFYFNWMDIASTVAVNPTILLVLGSIVVVLFCLALIGMVRHSSWAINLVLGLAVFDIIGEFYAQGTLAIQITLSFLLACILLLLALLSVKQNKPHRSS